MSVVCDNETMCWGNCSLGRPRKLCLHPPPAARKAKITKEYTLPQPPSCLAILQCCNFTEFLPRNIRYMFLMSCLILCYNVTMLLCYNVAILLNFSRKIYITCSSCLALYYVTVQSWKFNSQAKITFPRPSCKLKLELKLELKGFNYNFSKTKTNSIW